MRRFLIIWMALLLVSTNAGITAYADATYDREAAENIVSWMDEYVKPYLGSDLLNNYDNGRARQCHAFTNYVWRNTFGYDVYSAKSHRTEASTDYSQLGEYINNYARPGDMLRVDGQHSMVITSFDEDTVSGYDWLYNKKERACTYTWEGVKAWGDGTQSYWLYQIDDSVYNLFADSSYKVDKLFGPTPDGKSSEQTEGDDDQGDSSPSTDNQANNQQPNRGTTDRTDYGRIVVQINNPVMTADGSYQNIDATGTVPVIVNDRTLLPVRAIVEAMGGTVAWNDATRTIGISYKNTKMELAVDSPVMKVNGKEVAMDVAPQIINDRTMMPIRYITENIGGQVEWFDTIQAVAITYQR
ncbi:copper amine oxidase N-terminal domain-containing protein [Aminipila butyrica]|uniref:Copper amine oxidase N-terminal domain-containing protein n=1 Tax=Aminipila butyrica TaxID=433296 RepID=A0A858BVT9_9FIRM|nr:copper amine oxidase N-terminal domain-containing protein [Aminipila butyrica]QIB69020.1 copper amine oxidase N-terminal domain-containing protein [Aminipila butyrica]